MSQQGRMWARVWSARPSLSAGHAFPPLHGQRTSRGIRSQAGSSRCLHEKDMLGGAGRGHPWTVMCNEMTRWEQNIKSFEFEVIFPPVSYLFLFFFFCVNIFILLWSSNNIWIITCAEHMVGMYSLVGMSVCIKRGSEPDPRVVSYAQSTLICTLFSHVGLWNMQKVWVRDVSMPPNFQRKSHIKGLIFLNVFVALSPTEGAATPTPCSHHKVRTSQSLLYTSKCLYQLSFFLP